VKTAILKTAFYWVGHTEDEFMEPWGGGGGDPENLRTTDLACEEPNGRMTDG
jgi:hypothetical protein